MDPIEVYRSLDRFQRAARKSTGARKTVVLEQMRGLLGLIPGDERFIAYHEMLYFVELSAGRYREAAESEQEAIDLSRECMRIEGRPIDSVISRREDLSPRNIARRLRGLATLWVNVGEPERARACLEEASRADRGLI
jgi:hypothetical protein